MKALLSTLVGLLIGAFYSLVALVISLVRGLVPFDAHGSTLLEVIGAYLVGFSAAGFVVGLLLPLARWRVGAALVGLVAGIAAFTPIGMLTDGWPLSEIGIITVGIMAAFFGPALGVYLWYENRRIEERLPGA